MHANACETMHTGAEITVEVTGASAGAEASRVVTAGALTGAYTEAKFADMQTEPLTDSPSMPSIVLI